MREPIITRCLACDASALAREALYCQTCDDGPLCRWCAVEGHVGTGDHVVIAYGETLILR